MNYSKIYGRLIKRAQTRSLDVYTESHHTLPCKEAAAKHRREYKVASFLRDAA
jgi:hypothetical protein